MCDYAVKRVPPEMDKIRRVVVVSPRSYNNRHGYGPGRCLVVPFSATDPTPNRSPADIDFCVGKYQSLTVETWAICSAVMSVSHTRLDRVSHAGRYLHEVLSAADLAMIEEGLRHAMGLLASRG
jgi:uncharacterized protein YifN (PemK superfamily)